MIPWAAVLVSGLASLLVSVSFSALREPLPFYHDEFSYLLAADTFAQGRVSNPTHPCWEHFESFHILQTPRYVSKYPPAQGLFLAFGQRFAGRPIVGAWLGVALGSAAVCWMLQGWTRPRWALLGGLLTAFHHGIHSGIDVTSTIYSWSQSFWGGGPAMIGGALLFGALPRLARRPTVPTSLGLAIGLVLLANSRPFEGFLVALLAAGTLLVLWVRSRTLTASTIIARVLIPAAVVLVPCVAAMAFYNRSITGSVTRMPYSLYEAAYNPVPIFTAWQRPSPMPEYRHDTIRDFFGGWVLDQWSQQQTLVGWWRYHRDQILGWLWRFYVGPLVIPFVAIPFVIRRRWNAVAAAACLLLIVPHLLTIGIQPHYAAPVFGCVMLLIVEGLRQIAVSRYRSFRVGPALVAVTLIMALAKLGVAAHARAMTPSGWTGDRARIEASLKARGGRHLIIVRYGTDHNVHQEWVYNRADIDSARVVWARDMTARKNASLLNYFRDRTIWLLDPDDDAGRLTRYTSPSSEGPSAPLSTVQRDLSSHP